MNIQEKQSRIEEELNQFDDWDDKFLYLIEKGESLADYPPSQKTDEYLIRECQSKLWLSCSLMDNRMFFLAHTETVIVRGIVAVLFEVYSEATPSEIMNTPITVFHKSGLSKVLSSRITGLNALISKINFYASQHH